MKKDATPAFVVLAPRGVDTFLILEPIQNVLSSCKSGVS